MDRSEAIGIESAAIKGLVYLDDAWELFTRGGDGSLTGVFTEGKLVGFGKLTNLYSGYGWLESLRIHPDHQGMGFGKAIYQGFFEEAALIGIKSLGMYTGITNAVSRGLAERFGLSLRARFGEFSLPVSEPEGEAEFIKVPPDRGEEVASPHYCDMGKFISVNRTFIPVADGLGRFLAERGWLYEHALGDVLVIGYRFQPRNALHAAYIHGDYGRALSFALKLARDLKSNSISSAVIHGDAGREMALLNAGFVKTPNELITLWKG
jgi:GNAT superfamily N-acetyltransferase